jgi:hypothetical protein
MKITKLKVAKDFKRHFSKNTEMTKKHMKIYIIRDALDNGNFFKMIVFTTMWKNWNLQTLQLEI